MTYKIEIQPANIHYPASSDATLLDAALANQLALEHSCKKGTCGTCSATVVSGTVKNESGECVNKGTVLTCQSYAQSDVVLKATYYPELADIPCVTLPCKIDQQQFLADDILILTLRLPPTAAFRYLPGQYIDLIAGDLRRSYSIANIHSSAKTIELHVRLLSDGAFSQILKQSMLNQLMRLEGPKGTFFVREAPNPIVFLAGGTGFAPVKAMVDGLLANDSPREIHIYWGMQRHSSLYTDVAKSWANAYHHVHYVPVVSSDDKEWSGRRGFVHQAVLDDLIDLHDYHVYACGAPAMIDAAKDAFTQKGLDASHFYSDAFVPS